MVRRLLATNRRGGKGEVLTIDHIVPLSLECGAIPIVCARLRRGLIGKQIKPDEVRIFQVELRLHNPVAVAAGGLRIQRGIVISAERIETGLIIAIPAYLLINRIVSQRDHLEVFFTTLESLTMQNYKGILETDEFDDPTTPAM